MDKMSKRAISRALIVGILAVIVVVAGSSYYIYNTYYNVASGPRTLVVHVWAAWETVERKIANEFQRLNPGVTVTLVYGASTEIVAKLRVEKGAPTIDVAHLDYAPALQAIDEGLLDEIRASNIPNLEDTSPYSLFKGGAVGYTHCLDVGIAYNTEKINTTITPITSWKDLWNPAFNGHVAIPRVENVAGYMFIALTAKIWGANESDYDTAFQKLQELKPLSAIWKSSSDCNTVLQQTDTWITLGYHSTLTTLKQAPFPLAIIAPSEGVINDPGTMVVVNGTKNRDLAEKYIDFELGVWAQTVMMSDKLMRPMNKNVPTASALLFPGEAQGLVTFINLDMDTLNRNYATLVDRFNREIRG